MSGAMLALRKAWPWCQRCWSSQRLEVHHILPTTDGGSDDEDNLAVLCRLCHQEFHRYFDEWNAGSSWHQDNFDRFLKSEPALFHAARARFPECADVAWDELRRCRMLDALRLWEASR